MNRRQVERALVGLVAISVVAGVVSLGRALCEQATKIVERHNQEYEEIIEEALPASVPTPPPECTTPATGPTGSEASPGQPSERSELLEGFMEPARSPKDLAPEPRVLVVPPMPEVSRQDEIPYLYEQDYQDEVYDVYELE